jgi:hypothetical protein
MSVLIEAVLRTRDDYDLRSMQDDLIEGLNRQPHILVIDQAQELTTKAASQLQYLHDRPDTSWTLVLLGSDNLERASTTSARLRQDIMTVTEIRPLKNQDLIRALGAMHASFAISDPVLLKIIDQQACYGLLRRWGLFLQHALHLTEATTTTPEIDETLARDVLSLMPTCPKPKT